MSVDDCSARGHNSRHIGPECRPQAHRLLERGLKVGQFLGTCKIDQLRVQDARPVGLIYLCDDFQMDIWVF